MQAVVEVLIVNTNGGGHAVIGFHLAKQLRAAGHSVTVLPSPATHAVLAQLKVGETVYQAGELPKTLRVSKMHTNHLKQCVTHLVPRFSRLQWKMVTGLGAGAGRAGLGEDGEGALQPLLGAAEHGRGDGVGYRSRKRR